MLNRIWSGSQVIEIVVFSVLALFLNVRDVNLIWESLQLLHTNLNNRSLHCYLRNNYVSITGSRQGKEQTDVQQSRTATILSLPVI